ncbi:nitroreductase family protein [Ancylobacter defluvii]|uniref:Putative NAD(P)H nitroreductase n=1 Tax=Ancylobacter defluvii TaxID=1282440 RepID=A0A9W6NBT6_9HYPH|nr:nitroreductase [Ancylobacter defluvii]GLK84851.1 nitroreductase [Ancylobacter defluvii]
MSDITSEPVLEGAVLRSAPHLLDAMARRRSVPAAALAAPAPSDEQLRQILTLAVRVPDHGLREPWRFVVIAGEARAELGRGLAPLYRAANPQMDAPKREKFAGIMERLFLSAPMAVVVISRPDRACAIPLFEQELSAGAVCMNLLHAAQASGFGAMWVTGWAATNPDAAALIGAGEGERIAGILHVGTAASMPPERSRPDVEALTSFWAPPAA